MREVGLQQDRAKFRNNLKKLGMIMAYEMSKSFDYEERSIDTPLSRATVMVMKDSPVLIGILRAAMPFVQGINEIFEQSDVGFVGTYRKENTDEVSVETDYIAVPDITGRNVIIADPMLATGKSFVDVINRLLENKKPNKVDLVCAVAAPEGIEYLSKNLRRKITLWTGALDDKLNDKFYIVPGLGDAGDLSFGTKV